MSTFGNMKKISLILAGMFLALAMSGANQAAEGSRKSFSDLFKSKNVQKAANMKVLKLGNGLQAVIEENHSAPVVALQVWVKAGSADESDDQAGVAHLIEHMIFKGSEKFGVGELANTIESKGGEINAFTDNDFTVYHTVIASRFTELALDLFSDSVLHPKFDSEELYREREVVLEEIRRQGDNPGIQIYLKLMGLAYQAYPYRRPVIGYQNTVGSFEQEQLLKFFNCHYRPKDMIVVLVGDIGEKDAAGLLKKYFGKEKNQAEACPAVNPRSVSEPEQAEFKPGISPGKLERAYISLGWKIPGFGAADMAGLDLLASILGQGESSRLTENVRDSKKLVDQIWAYSNTPVGPGIFIIGASLDPANLVGAGSEILKQVDRIRDQGVFDWELERAKRQLESDSIYARESVEGRSRRLGFFSAVANNPDYEKIYLDQVEKVDAKEIQRLAQKYLTVSRLAFAGMVPEGNYQPDLEGKLKAALLEESGRKAAPEVAEKAGTVVSARLWPIASYAGSGALVSDPKRYVLANGIRLIVRENHYVPLVSVRAGFPGGVRFEDETNNGVFNFIAEMLTEGTKTLSAQEIHRRIEALAGNISGFAGKNTFGASLTIPSANFDPGLELFSDLVQNPGFPDSDVNRIRSLILASLKREQDQPRIMVTNMFLKTLFHNYPYRFDPLGTEAAVKKINRLRLLETYQRFAGPNNLVIAVSGDVNAEQVKARMAQLFGNWQTAPAAITAPPPEPALLEPRISETEREGMQAQIMMGWLGTTVSASDQPGMDVFSEVLGGMSGRLFLELREKKSLAYEVSSFHMEGPELGYVGGYIGCAPEKKQEAIDGMKSEFEKMKSAQLSDEELSRARNGLIGGYEIDLQSNMSVAAHMFMDEVLGLEFGHWQKYASRIEQVTAGQIQGLANKYFGPGYALVVINPKPAANEESPAGPPDSENPDK